MSCRELCRLTFRGCLRIPGCKTICFNCVLRPFCSADSDDEQGDDKEDEGYDSYGISTSQNHLADHHRPTTHPVDQQYIETHDYVNESEVCQGDIRMPPVKYDEHSNVSNSGLQYADIMDVKSCPDNSHEYVNETVPLKLAKESTSNDKIISKTTNRSLSVVKSECINNRTLINEQNFRQDAVQSQQTLILLETDL